MTLFMVLALLGFAFAAFLQNMAFTWSSRSRASGDPNYHRYASWCSNGVYYITNALLTLYIVKTGGLAALALQGVIYTIVTAEGSVWMMKILLRKETGKRKVGAGQDVALFTKAEGDALRAIILKMHYAGALEPVQPHAVPHFRTVVPDGFRAADTTDGYRFYTEKKSE